MILKGRRFFHCFQNKDKNPSFLYKNFIFFAAFLFFIPFILLELERRGDMDQDLQLIKQVLAGNKAAFEKIVEKYKGYVFAIIFNFVKDHYEVESIAQEVFLQIYISLPEFKFDNFKGWISRITANKAIDWKRKKQSKFREETMEYMEAIADREKIGEYKTPEDLLIEKEHREKIRRVCKNIPSIYENVIIKYYFQEKSYEEIAEEEGITVKTVASRLYRGRNILREKWRLEEDETL
ncbi:RNA polymerase sigma factor, sigma-70 family [Tepidimicrobium xylanilyticum]|uniref:RNA polymerase sigma factor, sigma-70 family n=2 Tax=Tepidimicrobium xylanilyticum TaxID=1123352 RepID=A0A1H3E8I7_9FIRM|nr:RNA polymerase sigma factor, sigma-70 family [Tepidimicrobium xylanilyticum]